MDEIVTVREMRPEDEPQVAALFASCEDYFAAATGGPALPADVQSLYYALPEGADFDQKRLLVMCRGEGVVGLVDVVDRYPDAESCSVGMFLVDPEVRREGIGTGAGRRLVAEVAGRGMRTVAATCPGGWEPGLGFLRSMGFEVGAPQEPVGGTVGNRTRSSGETGLCTATLRLADR